MLIFRDLMPDTPIAFDNGAQEIYSDGVATVERLGPNFRATYYTWGRIPGQTVFIRIPVVRIVRPVESMHGGILTCLREPSAMLN